ncbi:terminase [bacterium]|nr:terminase [bacterium]
MTQILKHKETMKSVSNALDMTPLPIAVKEEEVTMELPDESVQDDFDYARDNMRQLISKGQNALDGILMIASGSEHPRAYEVVAALMKTMAETNKDLLELQKTKKVLQKEDPKAPQIEGPQNVTNNLFVGSTAELQKMLKEKQDGYIESNPD